MSSLNSLFGINFNMAGVIRDRRSRVDDFPSIDRSDEKSGEARGNFWFEYHGSAESRGHGAQNGDWTFNDDARHRMNNAPSFKSSLLRPAPPRLSPVRASLTRSRRRAFHRNRETGGDEMAGTKPKATNSAHAPHLPSLRTLCA